jgi:hypothetical protein
MLAFLILYIYTRLPSIPPLPNKGSYGPAVVNVKSRSHAMLIQDEAASKCSLAFRAPELFDVPSACVLDERRDVWSLGIVFIWSVRVNKLRLVVLSNRLHSLLYGFRMESF